MLLYSLRRYYYNIINMMYLCIYKCTINFTVILKIIVYPYGQSVVGINNPQK